MTGIFSVGFVLGALSSFGICKIYFRIEAKKKRKNKKHIIIIITEIQKITLQSSSHMCAYFVGFNSRIAIKLNAYVSMRKLNWTKRLHKAIIIRS